MEERNLGMYILIHQWAECNFAFKVEANRVWWIVFTHHWLWCTSHDCNTMCFMLEFVSFRAINLVSLATLRRNIIKQIISAEACFVQSLYFIHLFMWWSIYITKVDEKRKCKTKLGKIKKNFCHWAVWVLPFLNVREVSSSFHRSLSL